MILESIIVSLWLALCIRFLRPIADSYLAVFYHAGKATALVCLITVPLLVLLFQDQVTQFLIKTVTMPEVDAGDLFSCIVRDDGTNDTMSVGMFIDSTIKRLKMCLLPQ
jgi:hypothetical protein